MRQFDYSELADRTWDNEIISYISKIHEYKGKQELFLRQKPVELDRLIELAKVQSTEASNRIEGIITTNSRLKQLVVDKTTPRNRDEEEILGYRNVLNLIHESYDAIPVRRNYILQLHKEMLAYTNLSFAGQFKTTSNEIDMITADGEKIVLFRPPQPYETPGAINQICESFQRELDLESVDELILIPCFLLDFLCIHPFNDGNGRMSRLLTLLLLNKCGYLVGQYISIEKAIADTKEAYYDSLQRADLNWHEGTNDPKPFIKYMLGIILECYRDFENRVYIVHGAGSKSTSYDIVKACVTERLGKFSKQEILALCPSLGSSSVESALKKLVDEGYLVRLGSGRRTMYVRADAKEAGLHFKKGLGWKACFDEERGIYTAERSWRGFYQLCEIDKETYDKLDPTGKNGEDPDKLIGGGRVLVEADDDYYTMPYCMVKDENYNELAPWSRAKERYERTYNEDKGNGS